MFTMYITSYLSTLSQPRSGKFKQRAKKTIMNFFSLQELTLAAPTQALPSNDIQVNELETKKSKKYQSNEEKTRGSTLQR